MFRISNRNKRTIVFITYTKQKQSLGLYQTSDTERNLIGHRTQSDRAADGIRSDGGRKTVTKRGIMGDKWHI